MNDPIIPDTEENSTQIRQLDQSQEFAATRSPDEAADTMSYAKKAGLDFQAAEKMKPRFPWLARDSASWGGLVKDHPVLAEHLADPGFASVAKDDTHNLSTLERLFGGWDDMAWASKLALEGDTRSQELAKVGRAMRYGKATPEMLKRADELDKESAAPAPHVGFVPGIVPAVVGMLPGLGRATDTALGYGAAGAAGGAAVGSIGAGVGAVPGAIAGGITMSGAGFVVGMAMDTAATEQGLAYRDYTKMGADPKVAGVAADIVALANGGLQAIPAEKILNIVPGLKGLIAGKATRDVMRRLISSNTGRAALGRFAGRVAESGLLMALIGASQELIRETGAIQSGADTQYHGGRLWDAGVGGMQQGLGFGGITKALPLRGDLYEARAAENRATLYKTLGQLATDSKLRERMPDAYKAYANAVIKKYGKVDEVKAPAEALSNLFQKEGISNEQLQEVMPEVAKQLRESKPTDEVVIPMGDLATHLAPLNGFPEMANDLRVGDELTPREGKQVAAEVEKAQAAHEETKKEIASGEATPARKVYDAVFDKLTKAGQAPEVAGPDATLWAAFAKARGERLGIDPFEYFSKRAVNIGAEFGDAPMELTQVDHESPEFKKWFRTSKIVDENGKPRVVYHGTTHTFETFDAESSNHENHYSSAHYFTSHPEDAGTNYAGEGPDLTGRIEMRAENILNESEEGIPQYGSKDYDAAYEKAREQARKELRGGGESIMPVHLRMENPVVIEKGGGTYLSGDELNGKRVLRALDKVGEKYGIDLSQLKMFVWDGTNAHDFEQELRSFDPILYAEDKEGRLASNAIIRDIWKEAKFDGIDMNASQAFGAERKVGAPMADVDEDTRHYVVFKANQIKSVFNRGTFSDRTGNVLKQAVADTQFPIVEPKALVDGLAVRDVVPNMGSIAASLNESETLPGIRRVKLSDFTGTPEDTPRARELAKQIAESGELNPLIVAKDKDGLYILEGANRFDALGILGKKEFPAVVVLDRDGKTGISELEQAAFHGSPYKFEKFTLDHIGSGEGAQVYGWGLYFAEEKAVAEYYKEALGDKFNGMNPAEFASEVIIRIKDEADRFEKNGDPRYPELGPVERKRLAEASRKDSEKIMEWIRKHQVETHVDDIKQLAKDAEVDISDLLNDSARLYEVDLPEKSELLDYDKSIAEQPPVVLAKLKKAGLVREPPKDPRELIREFLASDFAKSFSDGSEVRSAKYYLEHGSDEEINAYLDAKRKDSSAAINNTVLKDSGGTFYDRLARELGGARAASLKLHEAGIPGLKYLDQGSRRPETTLLFDGEEITTDTFNKLSKLEGEALNAIDNVAMDKTLTLDEIIAKAERYGGAPPTRFQEAVRDVAKRLKLDAPEGTHNFVMWDEGSISILDTLEQQAGEGYRGKISFDPGRTYFNITLTGKANLSTFLHESGHAFLEFMRADAAHGTVDPDLAKIYEWLGVKAGEEPSVPQLEKFARGFEAYLREGKAPSTGLREAFRTFGAWLKMVYHSITGLGVELNDDIRGVMDRMLATDHEIEEARENLGFEPMKKPKDMPDAEYATYKERFAKAVTDTRDRLQEQALRAFSKTIGEERSKVRAEVEEKTKMDRAHNAFEALATGKRLDGAEVPEEVRGQKIARAAIEDYPGFKDTKKWTSITDPKGGLDPEILAPYYGFASGQEMLDALNARRPRNVEIKEETERRMREKYPDAEMGMMADQAVKAFHEEGSVEKVLWTEAKETAKYLAGLEEQHTQAADEVSLRLKRAMIKESAKRRVEAMTAIELQPGRFARAEETAAAESTKAFKSGDFAKAHEEKLSQIFNHVMWKLVSDAKVETEGIRDYLNRFNELPTRRRVGKAGQSYIEAIDKIITDIELKRVTNKEIVRRASLESYLKQMEDEDGAVITIPDELRAESGFKNYKTMTLEELRTVRDAVKNIESMARLKNRLFDGRAAREWNATGVKAAEHVRANVGATFAEKSDAPQNPGWWEKKKIALRESRAEKKMMEFVVREMDGGQTAGYLHEILFQPFAAAEAKAHEWTKKITEELMRPLREMSLKERFALDRTVDFLGTPMKMRDVIAIALNVGNDGNKMKLIEGYGYRGWTEEKVVNRLAELLTDKHLDLVEHFWKTIGMLWPEIQGLSERTTGLAPPKVEASKLTIRGRELEGGYYPIVYDRARSYKAEQIAQRKGDLFENNFLKPGVSKGFTETRTKFHAPLLLSLNVIPAHINEVIHYLTHYEPVRAVDRLLQHGELRTAITEGLGREVYNLFRPWLQRIAHGGSLGLEHETMIDNTLRHLRVGNTLNRFGFKITAALMQGNNILSTYKELGGAIEGTKYLGLGMKRWMADVESFRDPFGPVYEQSKEIQGKAVHIERELLGNFDRFTSAFSEFGHMKEQLGHFSMAFFVQIIRTVDAISWYAAREKAFAENHPRPNEYADSVVRLAQMGESVKDKAAIMFGGEGSKLFVGMYSWYSVVYNQLFEKMPQTATNAHKVAEYASRWWWMIIAPTVAMGMIKGKGPKRDRDEATSWMQYYGEEFALEASKPFPLLGVAVETVLSEHDARWGVWIPTMLQGIKARAKMVRGETLSEHEKQAIVKSTGILGRLPADALYNAYRYVSAVTDGKLEEPIRDLLFRSPGEWK